VLIATHDQRILERLPATSIFRLAEGRLTSASQKDHLIQEAKRA
jgi:ABC-type ATPase involved in cell division